MNKHISKYKIITIGMTIIIILFIGILCYTSISLHSFVKGNNQLFLDETASSQANIFHSKLEDQMQLLENVQKNFSGVDFDDYNALKETICKTDGLGEFKTISIADRDGVCLCNNNTMAGNISKDEYFRRAMQGETVISDGLVTDSDGEEILVLYVPVWQNDNVCGVLLGTFNRTMLDSLLDMEIFAGEGYTFIVNIDGTVIGAGSNSNVLLDCNNLFDFLKNKGLTNSEVFTNLSLNIRNGESGNVDYSVDGHTRHAVYKPIGVYNWYVVTIITDKVIASQNKHIGVVITVLLFGLVFLFALGSALVIYAVKKEQKFLSKEMNLQEDINRLSGVIADNSYVEKNEELDLLTRIKNKNSFIIDVQNFYERGSGKKLAAFFIMDLADFSHINETIGHTGGDTILSRVATKLLRMFNEEDLIGRVGGDEFAVLMIVDDSFTVEQLRQLAKRKAEHICSAMQDITYEKDNNVGFLTVSVGVAISPDDGLNYVKLYGNADTALEYVRENNKGSYKIFDRKDK